MRGTFALQKLLSFLRGAKQAVFSNTIGLKIAGHVNVGECFVINPTVIGFEETSNY